MGKVTINNDEIQSYLDGDHGVEQLLEAAGNRVLAAAKATAPVKTGAYRNSLHLTTEHTDRMVVRVGSDLPYAPMVQARHGNLSRALDAAR